MKRILYLHAGAEMYGADKVLLELIKGLDKSKYEAHVILPNYGILVEELKKVGAVVSVIDYPILRRKFFNLKGIFRYIISYRKYSKIIVNYVKENDINIIHNNTTAVLEGIYVKKQCHIPLVWHVHEIIVRPKSISLFIQFLLNRYSDKVVTVSDSVAQHITKSKLVSRSKVLTIYNGVDNTVFFKMDDNKVIREKFNIFSKDIVVGMIGRVNSWKGQNDFLTAMQPILSENNNVVAFMAGSAFEGEEWRVKELDERINSSQYANRILRIDYYKNTNELYNLFDVFILPSTNPDPLPTVVLEAMACGKPIVGYKHGGVCEMVVDNVNGLLSKPKDINKLSENISFLINHREKINEFGKMSIARQKELFSLESYIHNFEGLYDSFDD